MTRRTNRSGSRALIVALCITCLSIVPIAAGEPDPFDHSEVIFAALGATETVCDEEHSTRFGAHTEARCASTDLSLKEIKKAWRRAARKGPLKGRVFGATSAWRTTATNERVQFALLGGLPVALAVDLDAGALAVYVARTYRGCHEDLQAVWLSTETAVPNPIDRVIADFPVEARERQLSGVVLGSFVVGRDGKVIDVCVVSEVPPGVGFAESAIEAQYRSRYEPAQDGRPPIAAHFFTTFEIMPGGVPMALLVEQYFQKAYRDR